MTRLHFPVHLPFGSFFQVIALFGGHLLRYTHHHGLFSFRDFVPQTSSRSAVPAPRSFQAISEWPQRREEAHAVGRQPPLTWTWWKQNTQLGLLGPWDAISLLLPPGLLMVRCITRNGYRPVIPVTIEAEAGRREAKGQPGQLLRWKK